MTAKARHGKRALTGVLLLGLIILAAVPAAGGCVPKRITATDDAGRQITLDHAPVKIVSMAPSNTEILYALGLGDRVVGVTTFCNYPAETAGVAKVGDSWSPDYEKIVSLEPDVVFAVGTAESELVKGLEGYGLKVVVLQAATVSQVADDVRLVAKVCGVEEAGETLASELESRIEAVSRRVTAVPVEQHPTVFWCLDSDLWTVGPNSFISDVITMAGGRNIAADLGMDYGQFSMESLLQADPDVIIVPVLDQSVPAKLAQIAGWSTLSAVKNGRVYQIDPDVVSRPGPRIAEAVEQVAALVNPETFGDSGR